MRQAGLSRADVISEPALPATAELLARGRELARDWRLGPSAFLDAVGAPSEAVYKRRQSEAGRIMQHAQVGFRDPAKSRRAFEEIHSDCLRRGVTVDRYGICLDWSMGYPRDRRDRRDRRDGRPRGTGLILEGPEDFATLTAAAPVAPHFGDFVLGFPAAVENTQGALAAGSTAIGNLGQYFTFRLPHWDDDLALTEATVTALALIAAQEAEILVHSNLDDGFAALFTDLASCLGAALIEQHIVDRLIGGQVSHCYGHHFSDPMTRLAFHLALAEVETTPGTMVYGNTTSYRGGAAENYASLAAYLMADVAGQQLRPSGHAINPVPVLENSRIPEIDEIVAAQLFAGRLIEHGSNYQPLIDAEAARPIAAQILEGGRAFRDRVLAGLTAAGFDCDDAFELLLALRRIGPKRLEELFGPGQEDPAAPHGRRPLVPATTLEELQHLAEAALADLAPSAQERIAAARLRAMVATTDVHEHGKLLVEQVLTRLGVAPLDGGVSCDPDDLARAALAANADLIALSTYNGVALSFVEELKREMRQLGLEIPLLVGGRLNQIPETSNTSLPLDVTAELRQAGAIVCGDIKDALPALLELAGSPGRKAATGS